MPVPPAVAPRVERRGFHGQNRSPKDQPITWATGVWFFDIVRASHRPSVPSRVKPSISAASRGNASTSWLPATAMTSMPLSNRPSHILFERQHRFEPGIGAFNHIASEQDSVQMVFNREID